MRETLELARAAIDTLMDEVSGQRATNWGTVTRAVLMIDDELKKEDVQ